MTLTTTRRPVAPEGLHEEVRAGVYVRRSTDDEHQPYSIEARDTRLAAYIGSQPGWRQAARFTDDASGATTARPGLQRALAAARARVIDVLLVYRVDSPGWNAKPPPASGRRTAPVRPPGGHRGTGPDQVISSGSHSQRKAPVEALVAQVRITGPGRIVPVFPYPAAGDGNVRSGHSRRRVRAMPKLVGGPNAPLCEPRSCGSR